MREREGFVARVVRTKCHKKSGGSLPPYIVSAPSLCKYLSFFLGIVSVTVSFVIILFWLYIVSYLGYLIVLSYLVFDLVAHLALCELFEVLNVSKA